MKSSNSRKNSVANKTTLFLFLVAVFLKTIDVVTTYILVSILGTDGELNLILRTAMESPLGVEISLFLSWLGVTLITLYAISRLPHDKWLAPALTCVIHLPIAIGNSIHLFSL